MESGPGRVLTGLVGRILGKRPHLAVACDKPGESGLGQLSQALAKLEAPLGKYSILGNHDYSDYASWPSAQAKRANLERLMDHHRTMGFRLLLDEHLPIEKNGDRFTLIGVQNWGSRFQRYGDLKKAVNGTRPEDFRLLMSHDPSHWEAQVWEEGIDLTLSGHTHGAQFGIERLKRSLTGRLHSARVEAVMADLHAHLGGLATHDDASILAIDLP